MFFLHVVMSVSSAFIIGIPSAQGRSRHGGLEPPRSEPLDTKSSASANSATFASCFQQSSKSGKESSLLMPQGVHRMNPCGAANGNVAGRQPCDRKQSGRSDECDWLYFRKT